MTDSEARIVSTESTGFIHLWKTPMCINIPSRSKVVQNSFFIHNPCGGGNRCHPRENVTFPLFRAPYYYYYF
jgi:hypothetical protein